MSQKDNRRHEMELFIFQFKLAKRLGLSRTQFGEKLGVKSDSVRRRALTVKHQVGVTLPELSSTGIKPARIAEVMKKFDEAVGEYLTGLTNNPSLMDAMSSTNGRKTGIYVVTSAQNATPIHQPFFAALRNYCEVRGAQLMVIPYRYKNPTSVFTDTDFESWDSAVSDYMVTSNVKICDDLVLVGGVKIQPTATQPLSGFEGYTGNASAIFGHPRVQLKTVPTPSKELPKLLLTTGAVTIPNYTDSKAGFKGEFHHSLAATIVEVTETEFHVRHVHGQDDGSFYDLDQHYTSTTHSGGHRIGALITGDTHAMFLDKSVEAATYANSDSMVAVLRPEMRVFHDLNDFYSRNHHHRGDDLLNFSKHVAGTDDVERELQIAADLLDKYNSDDSLNVIVKSNHDEALDRWLREANPLTDPRNARFYFYMKYHQYCSVKLTDDGRFSAFDSFEFWCANPDKERGLSSINNTIFLRRDESLVIGNIELGFHGDVGPNGARGSLQNLAKIGSKAIIGHSHSPGIYEGVYQVGTSSQLDMGYNSGPSSWMTTHAIVYPDGKRTLIHIVNGKWRG